MTSLQSAYPVRSRVKENEFFAAIEKHCASYCWRIFVPPKSLSEIHIDAAADNGEFRGHDPAETKTNVELERKIASDAQYPMDGINRWICLPARIACRFQAWVQQEVVFMSGHEDLKAEMKQLDPTVLVPGLEGPPTHIRFNSSDYKDSKSRVRVDFSWGNNNKNNNEVNGNVTDTDQDFEQLFSVIIVSSGYFCSPQIVFPAMRKSHKARHVCFHHPVL